MEPDGAVPSCPRCGYDLSGALRARTDGAAGGVCSECGLEFTWHDVLNPEHGMPEWLVERRGVWMARTAFGTWARACFGPRWFWDTLKMQFPIRARRLCVYAALLLALTHLAVGLTPMFLLLRSFYLGFRWSSTSVVTELAGLVLNPYVELYGDVFADYFVTFEEQRTADAPLAIFIGAAVLMPLVPFFLRATLASHRVRPAQVLRVSVYCWSSMPPLALILGISHVLTRYAESAVSFSRGGPSPTGFVGMLVLIQSWAPIQLLAVAGSLVWYGCVWRWAWSRYLRLPHGTGVAVLGLLVGTLASVILAILVDLGVWQMIVG